jgi:transposase-like protein
MEKEFWDNTPDLGLPKNEQSKEKCVVWNRPRCPFCNSADTIITNSAFIPYRYHKCKACGKNFTSFEVNYEQK